MSTTSATETKHAEFTSTLRQLADFLDSHPELPSPAFATVLIDQKELPSLQILAIAGERDARLSRFYGDNWLVNLDFGKGVQLQVAVDKKTLLGYTPPTVASGYQLPQLVGGAE